MNGEAIALEDSGISTETNGYEMLASAIVEQAIVDYRARLIWQYSHPNDKKVKQDVEEMERFFKSKWCEALTTLDGVWIMNTINKQVYKECNQLGKGN